MDIEGDKSKEPRVLAIASHVTYGYVGNKLVTLVLQTLGYDVSAINTVHFSNHTAYRQFSGRRTPAPEIQELYDGLVSANLADFDIMLSGYTGSPEAVETVGRIGRDLRDRRRLNPGGFFWILDPVMGDNGRLYVDPAIPAVYRTLLPHADLILPNAFEAATLAETEITDLPSVLRAISVLHKRYKVPHVVVTSLRLSATESHPKDPSTSTKEGSTLAVVGSSATASLDPRAFSITVPNLPVFFSGTGDMFAALMAVRFREASSAASLLETGSWRPEDSTSAAELPLARAAETVLRSMHAVLVKTAQARERELEAEASAEAPGTGDGTSEIERTAEDEKGAEVDRREHLRRTKASEIRAVRFMKDLREPEVQGNVVFEAVAVDKDAGDVDTKQT